MVPIEGQDPGVEIEEDRQPTATMDGSSSVVPEPPPEFVHKGQPNLSVFELQTRSEECITYQGFELYRFY